MIGWTRGMNYCEIDECGQNENDARGSWDIGSRFISGSTSTALRGSVDIDCLGICRSVIDFYDLIDSIQMIILYGSFLLNKLKCYM